MGPNQAKPRCAQPTFSVLANSSAFASRLRVKPAISDCIEACSRLNRSASFFTLFISSITLTRWLRGCNVVKR